MKTSYLGVEILLTSAPKITVGGTDESPNYTVSAGGSLIYIAGCKYGNAYGTSEEVALDGIKQIINASLPN